jgi:hypothetical protein
MVTSYLTDKTWSQVISQTKHGHKLSHKQNMVTSYLTDKTWSQVISQTKHGHKLSHKQNSNFLFFFIHFLPFRCLLLLFKMFAVTGCVNCLIRQSQLSTRMRTKWGQGQQTCALSGGKVSFGTHGQNCLIKFYHTEPVSHQNCLIKLYHTEPVSHQTVSSNFITLNLCHIKTVSSN